MSTQPLVIDNVTYFPLFVSCPVCVERGSFTPPTNAVHFNDGCSGKMYIGDNATVYCDTCKKTFSGTKSAIYCPEASCQHHAKDVKALSIETDVAEAVNVMQLVSLVGQITTDCGIEWLQKFLGNLGNSPETPPPPTPDDKKEDKDGKDEDLDL